MRKLIQFLLALFLIAVLAGCNLFNEDQNESALFVNSEIPDSAGTVSIENLEDLNYDPAISDDEINNMTEDEMAYKINTVISELLGYSTVTYRSIYDAYGFSPQRSISAKASAELSIIDEEFSVSPLSIDGGYADAMIDEYHISLQGAAANNGDFFQDIINALQSEGSTSSDSSLDSIISNSEAGLGFSHYADLQASFFNADEMQMAEYKDNSRLISSIRYNGNDNSVDVFMETDLSLAASIAEEKDGNFEYSQIAFSLTVKDINTTISESHYEQIMDRVSSRYDDSEGTEDSEDFKNLCRLLWGSYEVPEDYLRLEVTLGNGSAEKTFTYTNEEVLNLILMSPKSL